VRITQKAKLILVIFLFLLFTSSLAFAAGTNTLRHQKNEMKNTGLFDDKDGDGWPNIFDFDADGDGLFFWLEGFFWRDSDKDGVKDYLDRDSDNDSVDDRTEIKLGFNPTDIDTDDDGVSDSEEDRDKDGLADFIEVKIQTKLMTLIQMMMEC
jgi:hypothetical protein